MTLNNPVAPLPAASVTDRPLISWGAIIAGAFAGTAIQLGLAELCMAAGLSFYSPFDPAATQATTAMVTVGLALVCAIIALFLGGWVAGRLAWIASATVAALHGLLVWAVAAVIGAALLATTLGALGSGAVGMVKEGMGAVGKGAVEAAKIAAPNWDSVKQELQQATAKVDAAPAPAPGAGDSRLADRSRLMDLLGEAFSTDPDHHLADAQRDELIGLLASQTGMSREAAQRTWEQWNRSWQQAMQRFQTAKDQAADAAKRAAEAARHYTCRAAAIAFGLMLLGAVAATLGGLAGSAAYRRNLLTAPARSATT